MSIFTEIYFNNFNSVFHMLSLKMHWNLFSMYTMCFDVSATETAIE